MIQAIFAETNRDFITEKLISCGIALVILFALSPTDVRDTYIVLGQAHFTLTYLYQVKSGKATPHNLFMYCVILLTLFVFSSIYPSILTLIAAGWLIVHTYFAEAWILKRRTNLGYLAVIGAILLLNAAWLAEALWGFEFRTDLLCWFFLGSGGLAGLWYLSSRKTVEIEAFFVFLVIVLLTYIGLDLSGHLPSPFKTFGFIILAHYMTFYVWAGRKFYKEGAGKFPALLRETFILNAFMLAGWLAIVLFRGQDNALYEFWYKPISFYCWAVMHFISTFRATDYTGALKVP